MRESKRCPNCREAIEEPPASHTVDYARFWRDQCPVCGGQLVRPAAPPSPAMDPPPPQAVFLPAPSRNRLQTASRISWIMAGVFAVPAIAMISLLAAKVRIERWFYLLLTVPLLLLSIGFAIMLRLRGKRVAADIQDLTATEDACWAHWSYSEEEWRRFRQTEWANRKSPLRLLPVLLAVVLVSLVLPLAGRRTGAIGEEYWQRAAWTVPISVGLFLALVATSLVAARRTYQKSLGAPSEAYIGPKGAMLQGQYSSWAFPGVTLRSVVLMESRPAILEFRMDVWTGRSIAESIVRIPVPEGREADASGLVERFGQRTA